MAVSVEDRANMRKSLEAHNEFFKSIVDLVPPAFYFDKDVTQQLSEERNKHMETKLKKLKKSGEISEKARLRRAKFDPAENKKVSDIASDMVARSAADDGTDAAVDPRQSKTRLTLEELRDKLHRRIQELRGKRHAVTADEFVEKKKLRRKESKVKLKIKKKAERDFLSRGKQEKNEASKSGTAISNGTTVSDESKLAFSKFEFSTDASKSRPKVGHKNFRELLRKAEREQQTLAELKVKDASKAAEVETKRLWTAALEKAKGTKVRDDPALIKKSLKLQDRRKEKSRKEWQARVDDVERRKSERQEKRQKNIKARKQGNKDKKVKRLKSKGRLVSGF